MKPFTSRRESRYFCGAIVLSAIMALGSARSVLATTLVAQSFDDLVAKSEHIVIGVVSEVRAELTQDSKNIYTYVTLTDIEPIDGISPILDPMTLRFSGGHVEPFHSIYVGMPEFVVGQKVLLFVHLNGQAMCPLVGWTQGYFQVVKQGLRDVVIDYSRNPIVGVDFMGNLQRADSPQQDPRGSGGGSGGFISSPGVDADGGDPGEPIVNPYNSVATMSVEDFIYQIHTTRTWTGYKPHLLPNRPNQWIRVPTDASQAQQLFETLTPPQPALGIPNAWIPRAATPEETVPDDTPAESAPAENEGGKEK